MATWGRPVTYYSSTDPPLVLFHGVRPQELAWQRDNLLEILIALFARKLVDAVRMWLAAAGMSAMRMLARRELG